MSSRDQGRIWESFWKISLVLNLLIGLLLVLMLGKKHLLYDQDIKASDLILIVLAAVTVILAALAIFLGGLAIWGFGEIKRASQDAARETASEIAAKVGRDVAEMATKGALVTAEGLQSGHVSPTSEEADSSLGPFEKALIKGS